jgi:hypothetical protein
VESDDGWAADNDVPCEFIALWAAVDDVELSDEEMGLLVDDGSNTSDDEDKAKLLLEITVL